MLILRPRASRIAPSDADAMPLPSEETTPPVTKTNRVIGTAAQIQSRNERYAIALAQKEFEIRREFRVPDRTAGHNRDAPQSRCTRTRHSVPRGAAAHVTPGAFSHTQPNPGAAGP